jgi:Na+-transporting NADH:ubiquinone oxidoreductase subunit A
MAEINLKRGYDIKLVGEIDREIIDSPNPKMVALKPSDFVDLKAKLLVKEGDKVKVGTPLFTAKQDDRIKFTAPASGKIKEITRGARRAIQEVIIETDGKMTSERVNIPKGSALKRDKVIEALLKYGLFPFLIQRPFAKIANPDDTPRDFFVSTMNTAPLAADPNVIVDGYEKEFQAGLNILKKLTKGNVHLTIDGNRDDVSKTFLNAKGVELHKFSGPHPAGNVGIQIHHISPIKNRDDIVWTSSVQGVILIGRLFSTGKLDYTVTVGVAGSMASNRKYYRTLLGSSAAHCYHGSDYPDQYEEMAEYDKAIRHISGDVLTGKHIDHDGFIGYYDNQLTIIPERQHYEFLGWISPGADKASASKTFLSSLFGSGKFVQTTALNGGHRPFIASGIYEDVLPMDILPVYLLKSIIVEDVEEMEGLGIYEVAEEDFALCEYIDPSKNNIQEILRQGLHLIETEG